MENNFIRSSVILFADNIILAITGWFFWLVIGKLFSTTDVGLSTVLITLTAFLSGIFLFGTEFSLLKNKELTGTDQSERQTRSATYGIIMLFEISLHLVSIPIIIFLMSNITATSDLSYLIMGYLLLISTSIATISRYGLLGILESKMILISDAIAIGMRFGTALSILYLDYGLVAILLATLIQQVVLAILLTLYLIRKIGFNIGKRSLLAPILEEGISNFPGKITKMTLAPLSIILLGLVGVQPSDIGIFFIVLVISLIGASFATSMATVSLPSSRTKSNSFNTSLWIGASITSPLIVLLITFPGLVLSLINVNYISGSNPLIILSLSILPSIIIFNAITRLNSMNDNRTIIAIGIIELGIFLASFFILVPTYTIFGAAISILFSYMVSSVIVMKWFSRDELIIIAKNVLSIAAGTFIGFAIQPFVLDILSIFIALSVTVYINHITRALRLRDVYNILSEISSKQT